MFILSKRSEQNTNEFKANLRKNSQLQGMWIFTLAPWLPSLLIHFRLHPSPPSSPICLFFLPLLLAPSISPSFPFAKLGRPPFLPTRLFSFLPLLLALLLYARLREPPPFLFSRLLLAHSPSLLPHLPHSSILPSSPTALLLPSSSAHLASCLPLHVPALTPFPTWPSLYFDF